MTTTQPERHLTAVPNGPTAPMYDLGAEQIVLGAMMLSTNDALDITDVLTPADFWRHQHGLIYTAIIGLLGRNEPTDAVAVAHALTASGDLAAIGGAPYLHELLEAVPVAAMAAWHARLVAQHAQRRRLSTAGTRIAQLAHSMDRDIEDLTATAENEILTVTPRGYRSQPVQWGELMATEMPIIDAASRGETPPSIRTGFIDLDLLLCGGMQPGQLITVAARPGMGKTILIADFARNVAFQQGLPVLWFSLEMSKREVHHRIVSAETGIPLHQIRSGKLDEEAWSRIARFEADTSATPLFIDDAPGLTINRVRSICRRHRMLHGDLGLVVVDYLQLLETDRRHDNDVSKITEISQGLKQMARELECPVVAAAQLNRMSEQRADKRPALADLRSSGSIEQDSDVVILISRPDYHDQESPRAGEADLLVEKNRSGARDTITVAAQLHRVRFVDMAR